MEVWHPEVKALLEEKDGKSKIQELVGKIRKSIGPYQFGFTNLFRIQSALKFKP